MAYRAATAAVTKVHILAWLFTIQSLHAQFDGAALLLLEATMGLPIQGEWARAVDGKSASKRVLENVGARDWWEHGFLNITISFPLNDGYRSTPEYILVPLHKLSAT